MASLASQRSDLGLPLDHTGMHADGFSLRVERSLVALTLCSLGLFEPYFVGFVWTSTTR